MSPYLRNELQKSHHTRRRLLGIYCTYSSTFCFIRNLYQEDRPLKGGRNYYLPKDRYAITMKCWTHRYKLSRSCRRFLDVKGRDVRSSPSNGMFGSACSRMVLTFLLAETNQVQWYTLFLPEFWEFPTKHLGKSRLRCWLSLSVQDTTACYVSALTDPSCRYHRVTAYERALLKCRDYRVITSIADIQY